MNSPNCFSLRSLIWPAFDQEVDGNEALPSGDLLRRRISSEQEKKIESGRRLMRSSQRYIQLRKKNWKKMTPKQSLTECH